VGQGRAHGQPQGRLREAGKINALRGMGAAIERNP
jgi:hypothetical protein